MNASNIPTGSVQLWPVTASILLGVTLVHLKLESHSNHNKNVLTRHTTSVSYLVHDPLLKSREEVPWPLSTVGSDETNYSSSL